LFKGDENIDNVASSAEGPVYLESDAHEYTTRELSAKTWPDFEKLFLKPAGLVGDGWWCWCTHHHVLSYSSPGNQQPRTRAERAKRNQAKKRTLVEEGCAHGILVYADNEPIGWCQYGRREELPRVDNSRNYPRQDLPGGSAPLWRVTCFVVDKRFRKQGVASKALKAALESIRKKGGGLVEAYPVMGSDQGPNYLYSGTVSMFEREGFKTVAPFGAGRTSTVVMRITV
jgi:GNAT superfamily N-acetyltransferase